LQNPWETRPDGWHTATTPPPTTSPSTCDTAGGQSGAAAWEWRPGKTPEYAIVGIHTKTYDASYNYAVRINKQVFDMISQWVKEQ
jgi:V8-like Glu-specific endopeptidase